MIPYSTRPDQHMRTGPLPPAFFATAASLLDSPIVENGLSMKRHYDELASTVLRVSKGKGVAQGFECLCLLAGLNAIASTFIRASGRPYTPGLCRLSGKMVPTHTGHDSKRRLHPADVSLDASDPGVKALSFLEWIVCPPLSPSTTSPMTTTVDAKNAAIVRGLIVAMLGKDLIMSTRSQSAVDAWGLATGAIVPGPADVMKAMLRVSPTHYVDKQAYRGVMTTYDCIPGSIGSNSTDMTIALATGARYLTCVHPGSGDSYEAFAVFPRTGGFTSLDMKVHPGGQLEGSGIFSGEELRLRARDWIIPSAARTNQYIPAAAYRIHDAFEDIGVYDFSTTFQQECNLLVLMRRL